MGVDFQMRFLRALFFVLIGLLALAPVASAEDSGYTYTHFGPIFPKLPGFTDPSNQQLADLAQTMLDPNAKAVPPATLAPADNPLGLGSGYTYFGQFLDHDLTLDTSPPPTTFVDPRTLVNHRSFRFDLDSVYGDGPKGSPQLYAADHKHFLVQEPNANGVRDLPRNPDGSAILVEGRNDENEVIDQIQVAFLKAHNRLIDEGMSFEKARATLVRHYRAAILNDFLPHTLQPATQQMLLGKGGEDSEFDRLVKNARMTPIEFSVAAYRFGHSQVRLAYELNDTTGKIQVFNAAGNDLHGGRPIPAGRQIDWDNFFPDLNGEAAHMNFSRKIDTLISAGLFQLPIPGAEATGSNVLAYRNMTRAKFYNLPSGQEVAKALGLPVITPAELNLGPGFENGTPLWYYLLAESQKTEDGAHLGAVGSRIVGETFLTLLKRSEDEDGHQKLLPEIVGTDGNMTISDLFVFAGVASRL